jgi:MFS family permease
LLVLTAATGVVVALVFLVFETAVSLSLDRVWDDLLHTDQRRILVVPTAIVLGFGYFSAVHLLDPGSPTQHGLGEAPEPTLKNLARTLFIGFLSLLAGASLGPEAVLVPASIIIGGWFGTHLADDGRRAVTALGSAGLIALFTAFFTSFLIGMLALFILVKRGAKLSWRLVVFAAVAAGSSYGTLTLLSAEPLMTMPGFRWHLTVADVVLAAALIGSGWVLLHVLKWFSAGCDRVEDALTRFPWPVRAILASTGLGLLFLIGGTLVQFTGNKAFVPLFDSAARLGTAGLLWVLVVKLTAIAWSRALHYRGGMIFPSLLACAVVVAIVSLHVSDLNIGLGVIAVFTGMIIADRRTNVLF